jgi:ribosomal protein S18 acetylase RimI-like enzyme
MLRLAGAADHDLITRLWLAPANVAWIEPPEPGEIAQAIDQGHAFLWQSAGQTLGFAVAMTWVPQVFGLKAIATAQPGQGAPLLQAVLAHVFGPLQGHRIGLDVTADNRRALRLYEKAGFQHEGLIRECWKRPQGDWADCYLLGLLAREWTK